ncbi:hypothetical protein M5D96_001057 [Drosophila gunungcola]|uniref:Major facilitator superfamily (MFS) profile domain-containing protein n=2 Tax=elegans subgroup (in: flies) TaxID=32348 RepID=A0A9Q0BU77_9MUSC|nr:hypothetical protein M5D96_001057 [Drosophila gunungcola]
MVRKSWTLPRLSQSSVSTHRLLGSVRLTYAICAFLASSLHAAMRNMLGMIILKMVMPRPEDALDIPAELSRRSDLPWTRNQELTFPGVYYYGYVGSILLSGYLADRCSSKVLFIVSLAFEGLTYILLPAMAHFSYEMAVVNLVICGLLAGCGNPAIYKLFVTWAHPTERTALLSFAYSGLLMGSMLVYPVASSLSNFGWELPFYVVGGVAFLVINLLMPRFMREAMEFDLAKVGYLASAPYLGGACSKVVCILGGSYVERRVGPDQSCMRRVLYGICSILTTAFIGVIILADKDDKILVLVMFALIMASTDIGFSGYWPTLLYFAPSFAGLLSGLANGMAHLSGFLAPHLVAALVHTGSKGEWNVVLVTLIAFNTMAMLVFVVCSSTNLQSWDPSGQKEKSRSTPAKQITNIMLLKVPSVDWTDQIIYVVDDDDSLSDIDDEPDFSEYMWMENEEEFDKNELQRLEEEEIMQECFEAMIEDELEEQINEWEKAKTDEQNTALSALPKSECNVEKSVLNPMADEFIPRSHIMDFPAS